MTYLTSKPVQGSALACTDLRRACILLAYPNDDDVRADVVQWLPIQQQGFPMKFSRIMLAAALAIATLPGYAQVSVNIQLPGVVQMEPPPPRFERRPSPRNGQVWVPGHWQWNQRAYVWRTGYWQASRRDFAFAPGEWVRVNDGWRWREGNWRRAERREERREERQHADRHDERHGHGHGHCPPGQAKKGRC